MTKVKTFQIAVGNGRHYGGGNVVQADAEIDDGHLDLYSLEMRQGLEACRHAALVPLRHARRLERGADGARRRIRRRDAASRCR